MDCALPANSYDIVVSLLLVELCTHGNRIGSCALEDTAGD